MSDASLQLFSALCRVLCFPVGGCEQSENAEAIVWETELASQLWVTHIWA